MKKSRIWIQISILTVAVAIGGITIGTALFDDSTFVQAGGKLPGFQLYGLDGERHTSGEFKDKALVINFWGTFCPPCKEEMPYIQSQHEKWKDRGDVVIIGINLNEPVVTVRSFIDQYNITFPILLDDKLRLATEYGVREYPTTLFVDKRGRVANVKVGAMDEAELAAKISALLE